MKVAITNTRNSTTGHCLRQQRRVAVRMAAANFSNPSSLFPRPPADETSTAAFCTWPRSCPWPNQETSQAPPRQPLQRLQASVNELFRAEDTSLPPDVEQLALFSDGFEAPDESGSWWLNLWRYQGL